MQSQWYNIMATTAPRLRVYVYMSLSFSGLHRNQSQGGRRHGEHRPASVWPEPLVNLTFIKWAIWNQWITFFLCLGPNFKVQNKKRNKIQIIYKNGITNVHNLYISLKSVNLKVCKWLPMKHWWYKCLYSFLKTALKRNSFGIKLK